MINFTDINLYYFQMEIVAAVPLALYIIIVLNKKKYNLFMLLTVGITVIFIVSFVITWRKLIQVWMTLLDICLILDIQYLTIFAKEKEKIDEYLDKLSSGP